MPLNETVRGLTSDTHIIRTKLDFDATRSLQVWSNYQLWLMKVTGFLNDNLQRIPNNEYYQRLSYSIRSRVSIDEWEDPVSSLNHISGYKEFSDLQVVSIEDIPRYHTTILILILKLQLIL